MVSDFRVSESCEEHSCKPWVRFVAACVTLRVQVPNNHVPTKTCTIFTNYPKPKYLLIGCLDPKGKRIRVQDLGLSVWGGGGVLTDLTP